MEDTEKQDQPPVNDFLSWATGAWKCVIQSCLPDFRLIFFIIKVKANTRACTLKINSDGKFLLQRGSKGWN